MFSLTPKHCVVYSLHPLYSFIYLYIHSFFLIFHFYIFHLCSCLPLIKRITLFQLVYILLVSSTQICLISLSIYLFIHLSIFLFCITNNFSYYFKWSIISHNLGPEKTDKIKGVDFSKDNLINEQTGNIYFVQIKISLGSSCFDKISCLFFFRMLVISLSFCIFFPFFIFSFLLFTYLLFFFFFWFSIFYYFSYLSTFPFIFYLFYLFCCCYYYYCYYCCCYCCCDCYLICLFFLILLLLLSICFI